MERNKTMEGGSREDLNIPTQTSISTDKKRCTLCVATGDYAVCKAWLISNLFALPLYLIMTLLLIILAPTPNESDVPAWCYANFKEIRTNEAGVF